MTDYSKCLETCGELPTCCCCLYLESVYESCECCGTYWGDMCKKGEASDIDNHFNCEYFEFNSDCEYFEFDKEN
jgi:hypothetical protein